MYFLSSKVKTFGIWVYDWIFNDPRLENCETFQFTRQILIFFLIHCISLVHQQRNYLVTIGGDGQISPTVQLFKSYWMINCFWSGFSIWECNRTKLNLSSSNACIFYW